MDTTTTFNEVHTELLALLLADAIKRISGFSMVSDEFTLVHLKQMEEIHRKARSLSELPVETPAPAEPVADQVEACLPVAPMTSAAPQDLAAPKAKQPPVSRLPHKHAKVWTVEEDAVILQFIDVRPRPYAQMEALLPGRNHAMISGRIERLLDKRERDAKNHLQAKYPDDIYINPAAWPTEPPATLADALSHELAEPEAPQVAEEPAAEPPTATADDAIVASGVPQAAAADDVPPIEAVLIKDEVAAGPTSASVSSAPERQIAQSIPITDANPWHPIIARVEQLRGGR